MFRISPLFGRSRRTGRKRTSRSSSSSRRRLSFEPLERRELLAGNVSAVFAGGNLTLRGDNAANDIRVGMTGADLVVEGLDGTMINGSATAFVAVAGSDTVPGNFFIHMRPGNDTLLLDGVKINGSTTIKGGRGVDRIEIRADSELDGNTLIRTGRGDDVVYVHENGTGIDGNVTVRGRRGRDTIALENNVMNGNVDLRGNREDDSVAAFNNTFNGNYRADGGRAPDTYGEDANSNTFNGSRSVTRFSNVDTAVTTRIQQFLPALPPKPLITAIQNSPTNADPINVSVDFGETVTGFSVSDVNVGNGNASNLVDQGSGVFSLDVSPTADGTVTVDIPDRIGLDTQGNNNTAAQQFSITSDRTPPTLAIDAPSATDTMSGPVSYNVNYVGADSILLASSDVTLDKTGTADGTVSVTGAGNTMRTVTINNITGDGTLGISIAAGTASDNAGNTAAAAGPSTTFNVDNTAPAIAIGPPSVNDTTNGPVSYSVNYVGADNIFLNPSDITVNTTGTVSHGGVAVNGTLVRIRNITGNGTLGISIAPGTASDNAGNLAGPAGPSETVNVANLFVNIGNAGNADDNTGFGGVSDAYRIGAFEVTNAEYAEFLNAVAATDTFNLYKTEMSTDPAGGINRTGISGSFVYQVQAGEGNRPVNFANFYDTLRYANWLHNGKPSGAQGPATTEGGSYTLTGPTSVAPGNDPINGANGRNAGATFWLPSEDEWYKAAYFKPDNPTDVTGTYFDYAAGSDTAPAPANPPGGSNSANFNNSVGNVTDVGAYISSPSPFGTFDQNGNVWEWTEEIPFVPTNRVIRGGSFANGASSLPASFRNVAFAANFVSGGVGFRIATSST